MMNDFEIFLIDLNWVKASNTIKIVYYKRFFIETPFKFEMLYRITFHKGRYNISVCNEERSQKFGKLIYQTTITNIEEYINWFSNFDIEDIRKYKLKVCIEST